MSKDTKIVHVQMINGDKTDIKNLAFALNELKNKMDMDIEFLITSDNVALRDVKYLIEELYHLYNKAKDLKNIKRKK